MQVGAVRPGARVPCRRLQEGAWPRPPPRRRWSPHGGEEDHSTVKVRLAPRAAELLRHAAELEEEASRAEKRQERSSDAWAGRQRLEVATMKWGRLFLLWLTASLLWMCLWVALDWRAIARDFSCIFSDKGPWCARSEFYRDGGLHDSMFWAGLLIPPLAALVLGLAGRWIMNRR